MTLQERLYLVKKLRKLLSLYEKCYTHTEYSWFIVYPERVDRLGPQVVKPYQNCKYPLEECDREVIKASIHDLTNTDISPSELLYINSNILYRHLRKLLK